MEVGRQLALDRVLDGDASQIIAGMLPDASHVVGLALALDGPALLRGLGRLIGCEVGALVGVLLFEESYWCVVIWLIDS